MTDVDADILRAELAKHKPARVRAYQGDELSRDIPVPNNKKRWAAVLEIVERLRWTSLELCDKAGGVLHVHVGQGEREAQREDERELGGGNAALLRLMITAQKEVLSYRERESQAALTACVSMMGEMTTAISSFTALQRQALEAQRQQYEALLGAAAAKSAAADAAADAAPEDDLESMKLLKTMLPQLLPMLAAKMLGPTPAPPPKKPTVIDTNATNATKEKAA